MHIISLRNLRPLITHRNWEKFQWSIQKKKLHKTSFIWWNKPFFESNCNILNTATAFRYRFISSDNLFNAILKGSLISEGISNLVALPKKGAKSCPWAESLNFPPFTVNNLYKFLTQGQDLASFLGNGNKVKIPFEIKPSLSKGHPKKFGDLSYFCCLLRIYEL